MYTQYLYNMLFVYRKAFQTDTKIKKFLKKAFKKCTNILRSCDHAS